MTRRPNILLVMADQFRRDALHHVGQTSRTDALDMLAREGISFRQAITNAPECIPARFALATGLYPHQTGVWQNGPLTLDPRAPNWMQALAKAGYRTSVFGKTHFHESAHASGDLRDGLDLMRGYGLLDVDEIAGPRANMRIKSAMTDDWERSGLWDVYRQDFQARFQNAPCVVKPSPLGIEHYYDAYVGRRAREYLADYDRPEPWFCWVSFAGPHEPWDAPAPYDTMYDPAAMPPALERMEGVAQGFLGHFFASKDYAAPTNSDDVARLRANYAGNVTLIDDQIGSILETLKSRGLYDETLIVFTSDHGEMNGDHGLVYKGSFLSSSIDIPLIVRLPASIEMPRQTVADTLVELIDVGATIVDYAGGELQTQSNARSLRGLIEGTASEHRNFVMSEFARNTMIQTTRWKCEFDEKDNPVLLVDLVDDPFEQRNLVARCAPEIVEGLRSLMLRNRERSSAVHSITQ